MDEDDSNPAPRLTLGALADRLGVAPGSVLVGIVVIVAAAAGGWWALSAPDPPPPEDVLPRPSDVALLTPSSTAVAATVLVVHVDGAVLDPGVHEVALGARVVDAVEAAGGLRSDADRGRLNLAQVLSDGQRVWVPAVGEEEPAVVVPEGGAGGAGPGDGGGAGVIDLNQASTAQLETLPGVGPTIAGAIVDHREREGPFRTVDDLLDVTGIGPARLAQLEPLVTV